MKEGISYSFLLNIIILFVFVCACVVGGIFSYYRAFRAGTIIVNEIEKYEGFNCLSEESIAKKLNTVAYNLPFEAKCNDNEKNCITDQEKNYKVVSYNLDADVSYVTAEKIQIGDNTYDGSVSVACISGYCDMSSKYQYGVYTYMYLDLPIVSGLLRFPIYNKTMILYDQRSMVTMSKDDVEYVFDKDILPESYINDYKTYYCEDLKIKDEDCEAIDESTIKFNYIDALESYASRVLKNYTHRLSLISGENADSYKARHANRGPEFNDLLEKYGYGLRLDNEYESVGNLRDLFRLSNSNLRDSQTLLSDRKKHCGSTTDWSIF